MAVLGGGVNSGHFHIDRSGQKLKKSGYYCIDVIKSGQMAKKSGQMASFRNQKWPVKLENIGKKHGKMA